MWQHKLCSDAECSPFVQVHLLSTCCFLTLQILYFPFYTSVKSLSGPFSLSSIIFSCPSLTVQIWPSSWIFWGLFFFINVLLSLFWTLRQLIVFFPFSSTEVSLSALFLLPRHSTLWIFPLVFPCSLPSQLKTQCFFTLSSWTVSWTADNSSLLKCTRDGETGTDL